MGNIIQDLLSMFGFSNALASDFPPDISTNRQLLDELRKHGANFNKLHPLEHHFLCTSQEFLKELMKKGESIGYKSAKFGEGDSEDIKYWYGDLIKETQLNLSIINSENSLMLRLACEFKANYDGWGTPIIK